MKSQKVETYRAARAKAQMKANELGIDHGLEWNPIFNHWHIFMLPEKQNRYGFELRCEVVSCEILSKCQRGHGYTPSTIKRFTFKAPDGRILRGPVQGAGGFVQRLADLQMAQRLASEGRRLPCYEPKPGCVHVYPRATAESNGKPVTVDLRKVEISED